jgi:hypothetical protein
LPPLTEAWSRGRRPLGSGWVRPGAMDVRVGKAGTRRPRRSLNSTERKHLGSAKTARREADDQQDRWVDSTGKENLPPIRGWSRSWAGPWSRSWTGWPELGRPHRRKTWRQVEASGATGEGLSPGGTAGQGTPTRSTRQHPSGQVGGNRRHGSAPEIPGQRRFWLAASM